MRHRTWVVLLLSLALAGTSLVIAQDDGRADADRQPERPRARAQLVKPWSDLNTLSADQKEQIIRIHAEALEAMRKIREKEEADIIALLTPENKAELEAWRAKRRSDPRARRSSDVQEPDQQADDADDRQNKDD